MFSQDPKHYRATPRTTQQAFGPYHRFTPRRETEAGWAVALGVCLIGAMYGAMLFWGAM